MKALIKANRRTIIHKNELYAGWENLEAPKYFKAKNLEPAICPDSVMDEVFSLASNDTSKTKLT